MEDTVSIITADLLTDDLVDGATLREKPEALELTRAELRAVASARTCILPIVRPSALVRAVRWISGRIAA